MSSRSHIYKPLTGPTDIRLLVLTLDEADKPVECILLNPMSLDSLDTPEEFENTNVLLRKYHALSYVWGDPKHLRLIFVNSQPFWVTYNLYSALRRLRAIGYETLLLWVDAICIDQTNISEREAQVPLMSRIYRQARAMLADLGEQSEGKELLIPLLDSIIDAGETCDAIAMSLEDRPKNPLVERESLGQIISTIVQSESKGSFGIKSATDGPEEVVEPTILRLEHHGMPPKHDDAWVAFRRFFASPYFRRLWVLQEFALAPRISVIYGDIQIPPSKLFECMRYLSLYGTGSLDSYFSYFSDSAELRRFGTEGFKGLVTLMNEKQTVLAELPEQDHRTWLIQKLNLGKFLLATDSRDKIYGLMGLASDAKLYSASVDYSQSYEVIYCRFARLFIENGHGIELLYQACAASNWSKFPTWVSVRSLPMTLDKIITFTDIKVFYDTRTKPSLS
jgi:Heterokaryon incompatibility protein (HET)